MTPGQEANGVASAFIAVTGWFFVLTYSLLARWWKSIDGRMMMGLGATVALTGTITTILTLQGFTVGGDFLRFIQAGLLVFVGFTFLLYSVRVWRMQVKRRKREHDSRS